VRGAQRCGQIATAGVAILPSLIFCL